MIVEWWFSLTIGVNVWLASLFPAWDAPAFLVDFDNTVNGVMSNLSGVAVWADWVYILVVVGAVILVWGIAFVVKLARAVVAHVPFFGGSG